MLLIEPLAKIRDRHALIRTTGNSRINFRVSDVATISSLQHELQFINRMERHDRPVRIQTVNDFCRVAVRVIQYRLISVNRFHAVAVKIHLMASFFRGYTCLFGFDYGKWFAVSAIEDIVAESDSLTIGHTVDLNFYSCFACDTDIFGFKHIPSGFAQVKINIQLTGCCLAHVRRFLIFGASTTFLRFKQSDQIQQIALRQFVLCFFDLLFMFRIDAKDADVMQRIDEITITNKRGHRFAVYQLQKRGSLRLFHLTLLKDIVNCRRQNNAVRFGSILRRIEFCGFLCFLSDVI